MTPNGISTLARVIYEERVRESLERAAACRHAAATDTSDASTESWTPSISRTRFQAVVRWLVAGLFLS